MKLRLSVCVVVLCCIAVVGRSQSLTPAISIGGNRIGYSETRLNESYDEDIVGKSFSVAQLGLSLRITGASEARPFLEVAASLPLAQTASEETRARTKAGILNSTEKDNLRVSELNLGLRLGVMVTRELSLSGFCDRSHVVSHRSDLMLCNSDGTFHPTNYPEWDEHVWSSHLGIGINWERELSSTAGLSVGLDVAIPVAVFITYPGASINPETWGEGIGGSQLGATIGLFNDLNQHLRGTIDLTFKHHHWNGVGSQDPSLNQSLWQGNNEDVAQISIGMKFRIGEAGSQEVSEREGKQE